MEPLLLEDTILLQGTGGAYFARTYTDLPAHNEILLTIMFYPVDSWDAGEVDSFKFIFDSI